MSLRITLFAMYLSCSFVTQSAVSESRLLDCSSVFPADTNHQALAARFGAENVRATDIDIGAGMYERGTTIHGDSDEDRVEILWKVPRTQQHPSVVRILGDHSRWTTDRGLTLGQDLATVQRLNGKSFFLLGFGNGRSISLLGFGFDYVGTQTSWFSGAFGTPSSGPCDVHIQFRIADSQRSKEQKTLLLQVLGDGELTSDHPALKALNLKVSSIWLNYGG